MGRVIAIALIVAALATGHAVPAQEMIPGIVSVRVDRIGDDGYWVVIGYALDPQRPEHFSVFIAKEDYPKFIRALSRARFPSGDGIPTYFPWPE